MDARFDAVVALLEDYFDGLHHSDTAILSQVFHPQAMYATVSDGTLLQWSMAEYFPVVDRRPSPASKGEPREDRIVSIAFAGPVTAIARVECAIAPRHFIDLLTCVKLGGRWQVLAKVFHAERREAVTPQGAQPAGG
ncbi:nuclear transport factor 2 family protein [Rhizobacter sp. Root1221]|uniref:nuclear transport factor 2 family protein n=1 Tax=Rhizobacter sp. Root1221 TaxID=1736433 RepID=UPI0006FE2C81|nr:nuclear transport factor 2 family protein [Rhizobacter sp. Root1221]KQV91744.1 hypothetical protein ASC87_06635 [Rhizobacter sp. Root1221]